MYTHTCSYIYTCTHKYIHMHTGGYETHLAAPPNATAAEREEMAELIVERKRGHLGPGVGNIMLRSFPSIVLPDNQPRGVRGGGGGGNSSASHCAGNAGTCGVATPKGAQQWDQVPAQGQSQILDAGASIRQSLSRSIKERSNSKGFFFWIFWCGVCVLGCVLDWLEGCTGVMHTARESAQVSKRASDRMSEGESGRERETAR